MQASTQYDYGTQTQIAGLQVGVPIPIHNKNQGNIIDAQAEVTRAMRGSSTARAGAAIASGGRISNLRAEPPASRALSHGHSSRLAQSFELSQTVFKSGDLEYLQLLTAQRTYTEKNREYVESLARLWQSVIDIEGLLLTDGLSAQKRLSRNKRPVVRQRVHTASSIFARPLLIRFPVRLLQRDFVVVRGRLNSAVGVGRAGDDRVLAGLEPAEVDAERTSSSISSAAPCRA